MKQIDLKLKSAEVTRILIYRLVVNNKLTSASTSSANQHISNMYRDKSFVFIDSNNIPIWSLFRDGLQLRKLGKRILANIYYLQNFVKEITCFKNLDNPSLLTYF